MKANMFHAHRHLVIPSLNGVIINNAIEADSTKNYIIVLTFCGVEKKFHGDVSFVQIKHKKKIESMTEMSLCCCGCKHCKRFSRLKLRSKK